MNAFEQLKVGRRTAGLTQVRAAKRLGVSQPYLSLLENGRRPLGARLARAAARLYSLSPTALPLEVPPARLGEDSNKAVRTLASLGYPGYSHVRKGPVENPATFVLEALASNDLDARVARALPWVVASYPDLDSAWLVEKAKVRNLQNRLGFVLTLAREVLERESKTGEARRLAEVEGSLEGSRLVAETTLGRESMPNTERAWLRANRPPEAKFWNVLTSLTADEVASAH